MAIILLQLFKDKYFKNGKPHLTLKRSINTEFKNYDYYYHEQEKPKLKLDNNILEGQEETNYSDNYNPPCRRDIYIRTFQKIKEKAWKILKENYMKDLVKDPQRLFKYIKNNIGFLLQMKLTLHL
jgi:hypothetical protein